MSSILESVEWGKSALTLLAQCNELDPNLPAVMHIRHTERPRIRLDSKDGDRILSTELGRNAAYEFGSKLPRNRRYRLYHTYIDRSKETAEEIHRGILSNNGVSEIRGSIPLKIIIDAEKYDEYIARETLETSSTPRVMGIFNKWVSGHFPPWVRLPALEFVQRAASVMMGNLVSEERNTFDIYVSHDTFIGAFLLFWFGVFPSDLVKFLDGFILQFDKGEMVVHSKFGMKKTLPPYWWSF